MENQHDLETFQDNLADYFECHGVQLPEMLQKIITKKCYISTQDFRILCAVQYGKYALVGAKSGNAPIREILYLDLTKSRMKQLPLD